MYLCGRERDDVILSCRYVEDVTSWRRDVIIYIREHCESVF